MYSEQRTPKCIVCKTARPTCGDPKIYCRNCANALLTGRPASGMRVRMPKWCTDNPMLDNIVKAIEEFPIG